jgi:Plavaka transposase
VIDEPEDIEYSLHDVEPIPIFDTLDISSTTNSRPEFPSEEFGDFMELLTKWNLSDACASDILKFSRKICHDDVILPTSVKQGRQLLDRINVPHLSFKKTPIMTYKEETYHLHYRSIFDAIKELLSNKEILDNCTFEFNSLYHDGQRIYHEQYNGEWWERVQNSLPRGAKVLSIILYSDATTCDHLGKSSEHPIYLTLGNIVSWRRNKPDAKVLLGYLPQLKAKTITQKRSKSFRLTKRVLYQYSLDILVRPLLNYKNNGFDLKTDNNVLWCYPFISVMLGDLPENAATTLTFNSANCRHPCHECLVKGDDLNNVELSDDQIILRTPETMIAFVEQDVAQQYSLHDMENIFWRYP